jgi:hypothetical protein
MFKDFYQQVGINVAFTSVYHPQSNGAVETANVLIFEAIKKILEGEKKGKWVEVMPRVVWSRNMTICRATNFKPFQLLYGAEAVLPEEIKHQSLWTIAEVPSFPSKAEDKDLLEPDRLKVVANLQKYQDETKAWRDPKVKLWEFDHSSTQAIWFFCGALAPRAPANWSPNGLGLTWSWKSRDRVRTSFQIPSAGCWSIPGMQIVFIVILFSLNL